MKLKEDFVAMSFYIIAAALMTICLFVIYNSAELPNDAFSGFFNLILFIGFTPVFFFCLFLVAIGRIIDLLNQINQKLNNQ